MSLPKPGATWRLPLFFGALMLLALALRVPGLWQRPFHTDEANNAFLLQDFFAGNYEYRGNDHHGPVLFYAASTLGLFGVREVAQMDAWSLRAISVAASVLLASSAFLFRSYLGRTGALAAATLFLLTAPFSYYGGMFLHETLLLLWVSGFLAAFWKARQTGGILSAVLAGVAGGLALATKETAAPILGLLVIAGLRGAVRPMRSLALGIMSAGVTVIAIFSFFGTRPEHAFDLFRAIGPQVARGTGTEHAYPFFTYATWFAAPTTAGLPWSTWLLFPLAGTGLWFARKTPFARTLGVWAVGLMLLFSALPYKTPWLCLSWLLPVFLLGALEVERWFLRPSGLKWGLLGAAALLLAHETYQRCVVHPVDNANPLAYSPSSPDLERLSADLDRLSARVPEHKDTLVQVVALDYWPLPWTLRHFPQTGFWSNMTELDPHAILLVGPEHAGKLAASGRNPQPYAIRNGVLIYLCPPLP